MNYSELTVEELNKLKKSIVAKSTAISLLLGVAGMFLVFVADDAAYLAMIGVALMILSICNTFYTSFVKCRPIEKEIGSRANDDWMKTVYTVVPENCKTTVTVTGSNIRDIRAYGFGLKKGRTYYIWKDKEDLKFFPAAKSFNNEDNTLKTVPLSSILFYETTGERYHETKISGGGGRRVSVTGAVVGKAVGGTAGAVLLGNKGAKPVTSRDVVHDNRAVALRFPNQMFINFAFQDYTVFRMVIPEKDSAAVTQKKTAPQKKAETPSVSAADEIAKYKKLLDDGAITKEEFELKKKQLLNL